MHQKKRWGIVLAPVVLLGGLAAIFYPREPLLLDHANRVLDMRAADPSEGSNYGWLSDHELIYFRADGNLWRHDTRTNAETVLLALTRQVKSSIPFQTAHWLVTSPDGKWVLWGQSSNNPLFVASIDGAKRLSWPSFEGSSEPHWLPDSQRWSQWLFGHGATWTRVDIHRVVAPHQSRSISALPPGMKGLDVLSVQSEDRIVARTKDRETLLKSGPSGAGTIAMTYQIDYRDTQEVSVWSLHRQEALQHDTIHLPGLVRDVKVSPHGDSVAWLVWRQNTSPVFKMLQRLFPTLKKDEHESLAIYNSKLDGSQMREIGRVDSKPQPTGSLIDEMRWLPGGKSLSFIANDTLWTVPVE